MAEDEKARREAVSHAESDEARTVAQKRVRELEYVIGWHIEQAAKKRGTRESAQKKIYDIQKEKQHVMDELHEALRAIDSPEINKEKVGIPISFDNGKYWLGSEEDKQLILESELLTDGVWGIEYACDASVPRITQKEYALSEARLKLRALLDRQIAYDEEGSRRTEKGRRDTYARILEDAQSEREHPGLIAEKMVENFFLKLSLQGVVSFEVIPADLFQDVEQKVDFIVKRKTRVRGVGVEASEGGSGKDETHTLGVQFTTNTSTQKLLQKKHQIERAKERLEEEDEVEDIVLVSIPLSEIYAPYDEWTNTKSPGGPDKLWSVELKENLFRKVLENFLSPEEIEKEWEKVRGGFVE